MFIFCPIFVKNKQNQATAMKKELLALLLIFSSLLVNAQNSTYDSLRNILHTTNRDTTKLLAMLNMGELKYKDSPEVAIQIWRNAALFADTALQKAKSNDEIIFLKENKAVAYNNIGLVYKRIGKTDSAVKNLYKSYLLYKKAKLDRDAAKALIYIGMTYRKSGLLDSALKYYRLAAEASKGKDTLITALSYNNIGYIHRIQGETDKALRNYQKAVDLFQAIDAVKYIPPALNNMAGLFESKGNIAKAIEYYTKSLKIYEQLDYKEGIAYLYNNIGHIYHQLDDTANALKFYNKSIEIARETGSKVEEANTLKNIGTLYEEKGDLTKAKNYYTKSYNLLEQAGEKKLQAQVGLMLGNLLAMEGKEAEAKLFYTKSLNTFKNIGDKEGLANSYIKLSSLYYKENNTAKALNFANKAHNIGVSLGFPAIQRDAAQIRFNLYYKKGYWKQALDNYLDYIKMRDSIANIENKKATYKQQIKYEYEKQQAIEQAEHQKEMQIVKEKEKRQRLVSIFVGIIALLILFFALFLYSRLRLIKHQKLIIEKQNKALESKNRKIMDSINYAERIQKAVLSTKAKTTPLRLPEYFILFKPKDVVSGDFYWHYQKDKYLYIAAADCTGHGVPGALMSMLGVSFLNEIVSHGNIMKPAEILDKLREKIIQELHQSKDNIMSDGIDMSLVRINLETNEMEWAGAHNPLWLVRNCTLTELQADKQTIGISHRMKPFTNHQLKLEKGDKLYMFSDGYYDQFGEKSKTKLMRKNFKKLILDLCKTPLSKQKEILENKLEQWKGALAQTDDILVIGIEI